MKNYLGVKIQSLMIFLIKKQLKLGGRRTSKLILLHIQLNCCKWYHLSTSSMFGVINVRGLDQFVCHSGWINWEFFYLESFWEIWWFNVVLDSFNLKLQKFQMDLTGFIFSVSIIILTCHIISLKKWLDLTRD